jgi:heat shock protein HtpX
MNEDLGQKHKLTNALHTLVLLGGMGVLLLVLGYLLGGGSGALVTVGTGLFLLLFSPRIAPRVIMRLYGARPVYPGEMGRLHEIVEWLAGRAHLPTVPTLYYVPTRVMNAFTVGSPRSSAIGVTDGLLRALELRELVGVLAHEMSHLENNDLRVMTLADMISRMTSTLSTFGQVLVIINLPLLLTGSGQISWLAIVILLAAPTVAALLQLALSRTREFDADLGAFEMTGDALGLASALEKMERYQRGLLDLIVIPGRRLPDPSILRTHPNTEERIRRLLELAERPAPRSPHEPVPVASFAIPRAFPTIQRAPRWHVSGLWF